ncbi:ABC transporter permease [Spirillospora sp. CA-294931]|uniref:ABC transporter permease n=1 Tax=Spirillospora sp. CA-294931 TaxID=3240042 RepID=UPI003D8A6119
MPVWGMVLSAFAEIRTSKVRVTLSLLCVSALVAVVTLAIALGGLAQQALVQTFEQETGRPVTLTLDVPSDNGPSTLSDQAIAKIEADLRRYRIVGSPFRQADSVTFRQVLPGGTRPIKPDTDAGPASVYGVDSDLGRIRRIPMASGRWLVPSDDHRLEPQLVVGRKFADRLGPDPFRAVLEIGTPRAWVRARVVGVIGGSTPWAANEIYMPYKAMARWRVGAETTSYVMRVPKADADRARERIRADATTAWGLGPGAQVMRNEGDTSVIGGTFGKVLVAVAVFLLILGSLPVLVLGLMAVRQRRSELGVQRCFGATGPDLFLTVLLEALIVSCAGGAIGVGGVYAISGPLFGFVSDRGPFASSDLTLTFPWRAALLGMGVAVCVGLFTGLIPALRAMRRSVIQAIRS